MVKTTSNRPKMSKNFQARTSVQKEVVNRIVELRNSGMGFRRISKRLEKEGLAAISKSTVANYCDQAQAQSKISAEKLRKDPVIRALARTEAKLRKQVNQIQMRTQASQRVRDLQLQRAETPEGRQEIFKNSEELKEFVQQTLYDSKVLKSFELCCEANGLPLTKTLSGVVGSLGKYETENEDMCGWLDLACYIEEQLDNFVEDERQRKRQEQLQKKFSDFLLNFRCSDCDAPYETMWIDSDKSEIRCNCGSGYNPICVECRNELNFDNNKDVWFCRKCHVIFRRPTLTYSDYTFLRELTDPNANDLRKDTPF